MSNRTNEQWLFDLRSPGEKQEAALTDLRAIVMSGLPFALRRYLSPNDPNFDDLAEEVAQDTLLRVLAKLDTFKGLSRFTTWVHKIAVNIALTELRRRKWKDVSLDDLLDESVSSGKLRLTADADPTPERSAIQSDMAKSIERMIMEELTEKQRQAMIAISIHGLPMEEVARRMDTNRNALYKLLHDARLRLIKRLTKEGLSPEDVLNAFEKG
jgi:RNA polymerase sigma-70 factor (ECF subfamily)